MRLRVGLPDIRALWLFARFRRMSLSTVSITIDTSLDSTRALLLPARWDRFYAGYVAHGPLYMDTLISEDAEATNLLEKFIRSQARAITRPSRLCVQFDLMFGTIAWSSQPLSTSSGPLCSEWFTFKILYISAEGKRIR